MGVLKRVDLVRFCDRSLNLLLGFYNLAGLRFHKSSKIPSPDIPVLLITEDSLSVYAISFRQRNFQEG